MKQKVCSFLRIPVDAVLIAIAALAVPCAVLTAYQLPFPLVPLIWAAVLIGMVCREGREMAVKSTTGRL